jgi:hypothetical protein
MSTLERIEGEIRKLTDEIRELKTDRQSAMNDKQLKISLGAEITAMIGLLTTKENQRLLFLEQQGKSSRVSIIPSQSPRCNPLPNLF